MPLGPSHYISLCLWPKIQYNTSQGIFNITWTWLSSPNGAFKYLKYPDIQLKTKQKKLVWSDASQKREKAITAKYVVTENACSLAGSKLSLQMFYVYCFMQQRILSFIKG